MRRAEVDPICIIAWGEREEFGERRRAKAHSSAGRDGIFVKRQNDGLAWEPGRRRQLSGAAKGLVVVSRGQFVAGS